MNTILEDSLVATTQQFNLNNISLPLVRAFMDDLTILSSTICGAKTLLSQSAIALNWADLTFRANKSRIIVIIKGRSMYHILLFLFHHQENHLILLLLFSVPMLHHKSCLSHMNAFFCQYRGQLDTTVEQEAGKKGD